MICYVYFIICIVIILYYCKNISWKHRILLVLGNALFLARQHLCKWKNHSRFDLEAKFVRNRILNKSLRSGRRCLSEKTEASISCSTGTGVDPLIPVNKKLSDARIIYAVAPAMGHNQVHSAGQLYNAHLFILIYFHGSSLVYLIVFLFIFIEKFIGLLQFCISGVYCNCFNFN